MPSLPLLTTRTTDRLLKAMLVFARSVEQVLETRAVHSALGDSLSSSKVQVLRLLGSGRDQTAAQLARYLGVSKPAVTQIVNDMVKGKLLSRRRERRERCDRREVMLALTPAGTSALQELRRQQRHLLRNALRLAEQPNVERWIDTLQEMAGGLAHADRLFEHVCLQCGAHADGTCVLVGGDAACPFLQTRSTTHRGPRAGK